MSTNTPNGPASSAPQSQKSWGSLFFTFVVPAALVVVLVAYVMAARTAATQSPGSELEIAGRIQKVGTVQMRDANRPMQTGEQVFKAQCTSCHSAGVAGAPKFGDAAAWAPRIQTGYEALLNSALKGKNAMGPQGGGAFDNFEVARAVVYMANAAGATFPEPTKPEPAK